MHVTVVKVIVKKDKVSDFIQATKRNHEYSVREPGNFRFDILQGTENSHTFILYEAYVNKAAAQLHKQTDHYHLWRETVADWMVHPRSSEQYNALFPCSD